ncbi:MAG: hypothetical protein MK207_03715 [Saprospiraceae bacterium]|nr:hypothetical protein [Saprospiraceae bacterium]
MKTDNFTKLLLTLIAINLTFITIKNIEIIPEAYANDPLNNYSFNTKTNYGLVPLNEDGSITVKLTSSDEIDVNITDISTSDELNVNIEDVDSWAYNNCNIPVKIENQPIKVKID